jgi:phage terminase small subunit
MRPQHRKFAAEYIKNGFNGVQAVYAAGYKLGYDAACVRASTLLRNIKVAEQIDKHINKSKMSADEVLEELSSVANSQTKISEQSKMKALEMLAKAHNLVDKRAEQPRESNRDNQLHQAKSSYILAALPELQLNNPDLPIIDLQVLAEQKFNDWLNSLNLTPVITDQVQ